MNSALKTYNTDENGLLDNEQLTVSNVEIDENLKYKSNMKVNDDLECATHENSLDSDDDDDKIYRKKSKQITFSEDEIEDNDFLENTENNKKELFDNKFKKISNIIDSESEDELSSYDCEYKNQSNHTKSNIVKYNKIPKIIDSDNDDTRSDNDIKENSNAKYEIEDYHKNISKIIDSENEQDELQSNDEETNFEKNIQEKNIKDKKHQRASAKIALDAISAIKSETQRMHRENHVNVPYHKPRNCTLKEFMTRKSKDVLKNVSTISNGKGLPLKMTKHELEIYVKYLDEREKESQKLFANEEELSVTPKTEESNELCDVICNNDIANEINNQPKIQIISDVLIVPAVKKNEISLTPKLNISNLKKLIADDNDLLASPTLTGDSNCMIDLDSGDMIPSTLNKLQTPKSGFDKLFEKFLQNSGYKKRSPSTENNNDPIKILNQNNSLLDDSKFNNNKNDIKPGANYIALKSCLRKKIFESRKSVLDKKINDFKIENEIVEQICAEEDEEEDYLYDTKDDCHSQNIDEENIDEDNENEDENPQNILDIAEDNSDDADDESDNADDESDNADDESDNADDESDNTNDDSTVDKNSKRNKKLSNRILKRFDNNSDDDDSDLQEFDFLKTSKKLSDENDNINERQEEELLELCSGTFDATQKQLQSKLNDFVIPTTQMATQIDESQLEALCSGTFTNKISKNEKNRISSDEEENEVLQKPTKRSNKTTVKKISYSDDEDEINNEINKFENDAGESSNDEQEEKQVETYVDYDSDENEVVVQMTKTDRKLKAKDFVENEAELSESEWGSADEDEKDLDKYDIELGDEDKFDQNKLQSELGKIHMRKMMDEDARELKKMQELLFEDEENDGFGRQKQFRWRKTENGFDINDNVDAEQENKESNDDDDDETEEQWRKMKHEREILLMQKQSPSKNNKKEISPLKMNNLNRIDNNSSIIIDARKFTISKSKRSIDMKNDETDLPFLISKKNLTEIRGSFLKRDKEILSKVAASLISSKDVNNINTNLDEDICRINTTASKNKNFLFTILSQPQIQHTSKRKLSEISDTNTNKSIKKPKFNSSNLKKNLIDHLDLTEL